MKDVFKHPARILIAPAGLKGSLSAWDVATTIRDFLQMRLQERAELDVCPVADGGDDTLSVLQQADSGFVWKSASVMGPLPSMTVESRYLVHTGQKLAILEAAQAHGYRLLSAQDGLAPMEATSYGVGQLLRQVITHEPDLETIVLTLGGSASTDGGLGALQALGVQFLNAAGNLIETPISGGSLSEIAQIQWIPEWPFAGKILIATDVVNPLLGREGAAMVFAPQKGATLVQCQLLEQKLNRVSQLLSQACNVDYRALPGVGAAGGLAYSLRHLPRSGIISGKPLDCRSFATAKPHSAGRSHYHR